MGIDTERIVEAVKRVKPLFMDRERSAQITEKGLADYVTQVDIRVQEQVRQELYELYPEVQFMGEEKDNSGIDFAGDVWILDPVDGTTNLIHDFGHSTLSLALARGGELVLGIVYHPYTDELFVAEKGKGARLNGRKISVSARTQMKESLISVGTAPYDKQQARETFRLFADVFEKCADIRRLGSAALELAYVACGRIEAYFERNLKPWDYAAGLLLIEEAGGAVTDFAGGKIDFSGKADIVGSNGAIGRLLVDEFFS